MADKKIVDVETKGETKKSGLNIDLGDLKKIGAAILATGTPWTSEPAPSSGAIGSPATT